MSLTSEPSTLVTAGEDLGAASLHKFDAFLSAAHICKSRLITERWLCERLPAEAAFEGRLSVLGLLAAHAGVVRLHVTVCAEVLRATCAPHTVSSLMLSCLSR